MAAAFTLAFLFIMEEGRRIGVPSGHMIDIGLFAIVGGILGARTLYVLSHINQYKGQWIEVLMIHHGGLAFYGGIIGGALSLLTILKIRRLNILSMIDIVIPALVLGHSIGRLGCFLNGCCFGKPTQVPWGVIFPDGSLPQYTFGHAQCLHPVQIYSFILLLIFFLFLWFSLRHKSFDGQILTYYLLGYPVIRFVMEIFRGDTILVLFGWLSLFQLISIIMFIVGLTCLIYFKYGLRTFKTRH